MNAITNTVEHALRTAATLMTIDQIRTASGLEDSVVRAELRQLAKQGQIEHVPGRGRYEGRYGLLQPLEPTATQSPIHVDVAPMDEAEPEVPPGFTVDATQPPSAPLDDVFRERDEFRRANEQLRIELAIERQASDVLREQLNARHDPSNDVAALAVGYIMTAAKRKPRRMLKPEGAIAAAQSAVRAGAQRAEVFALVPIGVAKRGAVWELAE